MKKHYGLIYKIVCLVNGKIYIGQTKQVLDKRWKYHTRNAQKEPNEKDMLIVRAIRKYGEENFTKSIICYANNRNELNHREKLCIKLYKSFGSMGYNMNEGGWGWSHTEESKNKISKGNKGKKKPEGFGEKIRKANLGTKKPAYIGKKVGDAQRGKKSAWFGKKHTVEELKKMSESQKGKIVSLETREKMSESAKKKPPVSEETKKKMSVSRQGRKPNEGKKHTEEAKRKMSITRKQNGANTVQIKCIENHKIYDSMGKAAEDLKIPKQSVYDYFHGKTKTAKGFTFIRI